MWRRRVKALKEWLDWISVIHWIWGLTGMSLGSISTWWYGAPKWAVILAAIGGGAVFLGIYALLSELKFRKPIPEENKKNNSFGLEFEYEGNSFYHKGSFDKPREQWSPHFEVYRIAIKNHNVKQKIDVQIVDINGTPELNGKLPVSLKWKNGRDGSLFPKERAFIDVAMLNMHVAHVLTVKILDYQIFAEKFQIKIKAYAEHGDPIEQWFQVSVERDNVLERNFVLKPIPQPTQLIDERAEKRVIQERLTEFFEEGKPIRDSLGNVMLRDNAKAEADRWENKVGEYLAGEKVLGSAFRVRFSNPGDPHGEYSDGTLSSNKEWAKMDMKMQMLIRFIEELNR